MIPKHYLKSLINQVLLDIWDKMFGSEEEKSQEVGHPEISELVPIT